MHPDEKRGLYGLALGAVIAVIFGLAACSSPEDRQEETTQAMDWCHDIGGTYRNKIASSDGPRFFVGSAGTCAVPPPPALAACYTTAEDSPPGVPAGTNWYVYYAYIKGGAGAGGLDKYAHCKQQPVAFGGTIIPKAQP